MSNEHADESELVTYVKARYRELYGRLSKLDKLKEELSEIEKAMEKLGIDKESVLTPKSIFEFNPEMLDKYTKVTKDI